MKYLFPSLLLLAAVAGLSGCAVSLQPFYSKDTIVDDQTLEGRWTDGESTWQVTRTAPGRFEIASCGGDDCKADTVAVLFRSAGVTFLDFAEKPEKMFNSAIHLHGLFEVRMRGGELDVTILDTDRISKLAERQQLDTDYADLESGAVLTARPNDLQKFVIRHLNDGQIFGDAFHLRRPAANE